MQFDKYAPLLVSSDSLEFTFLSNGPKGEIRIVVQFNAIENPAIYNLAFGNLLPNGSVDDRIKNDNKTVTKCWQPLPLRCMNFLPNTRKN